MALKPKYAVSRALCIGINEYKSTRCSPLGYAVNDASVVAETLVQKFGFLKGNVTLLTDKDATRDSISSSFLRFADSDVEENDRLLLFFAGHGYTQLGNRGEVGFLVPHDGEPERLSSLIRWDELTRNAELIRTKHMLFIMDACYGGLAITRALSVGSMRFLKDMLLRHARQVLTAGKANEVVADSGGPLPGHSIFTDHFLQALDGKAATQEGVITANGVMAYVYERVATDQNSRQTPHYGFLDGDGDFIFDAPILKGLAEDETKDEDVLIAIPSAEDEIGGENVNNVVTKTKEYLSDPRFRIKLDDLVVQLVRGVLLKTGEDSFRPQGSQFSVEEFSERLRKYETAINDLQAAISCIAYWGGPDHAMILQRAIARVTDRLDPESGLRIWIALRWYPISLLAYSGGIAAIAADKYDNLVKLFMAEVCSARHAGDRTSLVMGLGEAVLELTRTEVFKALPGHEKQYVPRSEYFYKLLQPRLDDWLYLGRDYEQIFDRFEVLFALVHADILSKGGGRIWGPIGRFGWKYSGRSDSGNPLRSIVE